MHLNNYGYLLIFALFSTQYVKAQKTVFSIVTEATKASIVYDPQGPKLDSISAQLLAKDIERVTSYKPKVNTDISKVKGNVIIIGNIQSALIRKFIHPQSSVYKNLLDKWECFSFKTIDKPSSNILKVFIIAGSDARGTAYGVFTLSEKIGISPWYWWADVPVKQQNRLTISQDDYLSAAPAVRYRGIFINDEDWGLQPWAAKTFEPETGDIGPKTYAKVFELLLRLKADLIWPAMHPGTRAFFHYPGNVKTAEDYQIVIGSSHAEPMLRNNVDEWDTATMGHYDYITNKEKVYRYWQDRVKESSGLQAMYTIGMRGIHDSQMEGVKDPKEAVPLLENIFQDQRGLLSRYLNKDAATVPQVFTAYKEVLEVYDLGLKVPDDVTLVWPDDNYGYIQRLNNENELARKGGAGVYYHASYWGRPHDYLWLPSTHPSLMREEMIKAYETGANRIWVLNVGDIKPQEYNMQQFLDMAYNPAPFKYSSYTKQHLLQWATTIFGKASAQRIQDILWQYFQLAFERRPEFMGWSQTEPNTNTTYTGFNHFYFGDEAQKRIDNYNAIENEVKALRRSINSTAADAFYELVYYPVIGAAEINKKFLYRDKAYLYSRQNRLSAYEYAQLSSAAYDSIVKETVYYNSRLAKGKWENMMSMKPRDLAVFQAPDIPAFEIDSINEWNIAPEGLEIKDSLSEKKLSLPVFDNLNKQRFFVDIFLDKSQTIDWTASVSNNWIHCSQSSGQLSPEWGNKQTRIWVDVDWSKVQQNGKILGNITFSGGHKQIVLKVKAYKKDAPELSGYTGIIENNGFVSIYATHFARQENKPANRWQPINGLGYTGNVLQALPLLPKSNTLTDTGSIKRGSAFVEYDFYTFSSAAPVVTVFTLPTHPVNNNFSVRYAVSIDDGPLKVVDIKTTNRSEEWKQNVLRNRAERKIDMPFITAGKHTLRIYCIDPGVMLDEIRIDLGGLKSAYMSIPETKME